MGDVSSSSRKLQLGPGVGAKERPWTERRPSPGEGQHKMRPHHHLESLKKRDSSKSTRIHRDSLTLQSFHAAAAAVETRRHRTPLPPTNTKLTARRTQNLNHPQPTNQPKKSRQPPNTKLHMEERNQKLCTRLPHPTGCTRQLWKPIASETKRKMEARKRIQLPTNHFARAIGYRVEEGARRALWEKLHHRAIPAKTIRRAQA